MIVILQLSDIHFAYERDSIFDIDRELQNGVLRFIPTILERAGTVDLVLVCGDVAYHGTVEEYATAAGFLRDLRAQLGDTSIPVRVVPGNHDIHRPSTDTPDQRNWRSRPRMAGMTPAARTSALTSLLQGAASGPGLLEPLNAYNEFAAAFGCEVSPANPHWEHQLPINAHWTLRLRGLTSVLVSDAHDAKDKLVLGSFQIADLEPAPGYVNLTVCHHPFTWFLDGTSQRNRLKRRTQLHITGHIHRHRLGSLAANLHLSAGALAPPRDHDWESRFNVLMFDIIGSRAQPQLEFSILAAKWDEGDDSFIVDDGKCTVRTVDLTPFARTPPVRAPSGTEAGLARLTERFATLPFSDQLDVAQSLAATISDLLDHPAHEFVGAVIDFAAERGDLRRLWDEVEARHGRQSGTLNPFSEES